MQTLIPTATVPIVVSCSTTDHLQWCAQRNLRPSYIDVRRRSLAALERDVGRLDTANAEALHAWYDRLAARVTPDARAVSLSHVASFYRWLVREGIRDDDPTARLVRPRVQRRLPRPIGDADLARALLDAPDRVRPWLQLAAFQGLRAMEIAHLRAEDLRLDETNPLVIVADGKGGKQRMLPMHPVVRATLLALDLPVAGYVFTHWDGAGPPKPHNVSHACNTHLHALGIAATLHTLRHWFATTVYRASHDLRLTQELMGHADPATTAGYAAWSPGQSASIVSALDPGAAA